VKYLTKEDYVEKIKKLNNKYWNKDKDCKKRWKYISFVVEELKIIQPTTVLELGANKINLTSASDNMGLDLKDVDVDNLMNKVFIQDATKLPYLIEDKYYDCFVGLQVFEHLGKFQSEVFKEIKRVSKNAILSFPYKWNCPGNIHYGIDEEVIKGWTNGEIPTKIQIVTPPRIVYVFNFM